jgi:hypothetical protein
MKSMKFIIRERDFLNFNFDFDFRFFDFDFDLN